MEAEESGAGWNSNRQISTHPKSVKKNNILKNVINRCRSLKRNIVFSLLSVLSEQILFRISLLAQNLQDRSSPWCYEPVLELSYWKGTGEKDFPVVLRTVLCLSDLFAWMWKRWKFKAMVAQEWLCVNAISGGNRWNETPLPGMEQSGYAHSVLCLITFFMYTSISL